jgi:hypothetical protein
MNQKIIDEIINGLLDIKNNKDIEIEYVPNKVIASYFFSNGECYEKVESIIKIIYTKPIKKEVK